VITLQTTVLKRTDMSELHYLAAEFYQLQHLFDQAPVVIYACTFTGGFDMTFVSNNVKDLLGYEAQYFLLEPDFWQDHLHPEDKAHVLAKMTNLSEGSVILHKYRFKAKDGQWKWVRNRARRVLNPFTQQFEIIGAWTDLSELIAAEEMLRKSEEKHRFLLERISTGILMYALDTAIIYSNQNAAELFGFSPENLLGKASADFVDCFVYEEGGTMPIEQFPVNQVLRTGRAIKNVVFGVNRNNAGDNTAWVIANAFPELDDEGQIRHIIVTLLNITDRIKSQKRIYQLAHYDALTQLPNRTLINQRIEQAINIAERDQSQFAVMFLDLDDFKVVNDSLGHHCGDLLLQQVAKRLRQCVRDGDMVGRLGGDEFVVLLQNMTAAKVADMAQNIVSVINGLFEIDGHILSSYTSIGISLYPHDGETRDMLTRHADIAMYHAKSLPSRGGYYFFDFEMNAQIESRLAIEKDMYQALAKNQFFLDYQPQIDLDSGNIVGLEALIRWQHPQRGIISPLEFIPTAEKSHLIVLIGEWVLRRVCENIKAWLKVGELPLKVAINLSLQQLQGQDLFARFMHIIDEVGIPAEYLELELTESLMMEDHKVVLDFMQQCRKAGIHFSIDDFGTGYSSLSYLTKLPLDKIKIDKSFVHEISQSKDANTIVSAIINMAQSLRLTVVAEGVETKEQLDYLKSCGCDTIQGFYFSPPLDYQAISQLLARGTSH
jgi:diguanylate cyclase (GGDEF)-like protein/PAS domain S-box-containing protein